MALLTASLTAYTTSSSGSGGHPARRSQRRIWSRATDGDAGVAVRVNSHPGMPSPVSATSAGNPSGATVGRKEVGWSGSRGGSIVGGSVPRSRSSRELIAT
jgi:hypothetical protein